MDSGFLRKIQNFTNMTSDNSTKDFDEAVDYIYWAKRNNLNLKFDLSE